MVTLVVKGLLYKHILVNMHDEVTVKFVCFAN